MEIKINKLTKHILPLLGLVFFVSLPIHKAAADLSMAECNPGVTVDNTNGLVRLNGTVIEKKPGLDPSYTYVRIYDSALKYDNSAVGQDSVTISSPSIFYNNGSYTLFIEGNSASNPGGGTSSCTGSLDFTVNVGTPDGTINITSSLTTGFSVSGPSSFSGTVTGGDTVSYSKTPGNYTLTPNSISGYSVSVNSPQSLTSNGNITFNIVYTPNGGGGGPPGPFDITASTCFGWPSPAVRINISSASGSTGYDLERSTGGAYSVILSNVNATTLNNYNDTAVSSGTTYTYRVDALNSYGNTYSSNTAVVTVDPANCGGGSPPPGPPGPPPPPPPGTAPKPTVSVPSCSNGPYTAIISWSGSTGPLDVFAGDSPVDQWWKQNVPASGSVDASTLSPRLPGQPALVLQPGVSYYAFTQYMAVEGEHTPWIVNTCPKGSVVVNVTPNTVTTSWTLNGPSGDVPCNPCGNNPYAPNTMDAGVYYIYDVARPAGYGFPTVSPPEGDTNKQTLSGGGTITWNIAYPPTKPSIINVANTTCAQMLVTWNDSTNETGYQVWRSTTNGTFFYGAGDGWTLAGSKAANVTSFTDSGVTAGNSYYYIVVAQGAGGNSASDPFGPVITLSCRADISNSQKFIYQVNGASFDPVNTIIKDGDTVTFRFTIVNSNTATDNAVINGIADTMSTNFTNARNAKVDKGSGFGAITITGSAPNITLGVTGTMSPGTNWVVQYDATAIVTTSSSPLFTNSGVINCTGQTSGANCNQSKSVKFLNKTSTVQPPTFKEVNP